MNVSTRVSFALTVPLLLALSAAAAPAQDKVQEKVQAAKCLPCQVAQDNCSVNCLGLADKKAIGPCLVGCGNAAATCTCDEPATLSAEAAAARFGLNAVATLSSSCNATTPCDSSYGACTNWSGFYDCGDPYCGFGVGCGLCNEWGQCEYGGPAMKQDREGYRVCFNAQSESCTEYRRASSHEGCGCS